MPQYRLDDDQGGPQPPKPPGWTEPIKPTPNKENEEKQEEVKQS